MDATYLVDAVDTGQRVGRASRYAPPRYFSALISRADIVARLLADALGKVTVLAAPHGSGKTVLLQQMYEYCQQQGLTVRWLSLTPEDNQPQLLRSHLLSAFDLQACLEDEDLADIPANMCVFIDGLELLNNPVAYALAEWFMLTVPVSSSVFTSVTRMRGSLLRKARLSGVVNLIEPAELRLTGEQAQQILGAEFTEHEAHYLNRFVDGWAAGLRFLQRSPDCCRRLLSSRAEKTLPAEMVDYFDEQFAKSLTPESLQILMELSVFERFTPALVEAMPEVNVSWDLIEEYIARGLFLDYVDSARQWVAFHPAFSLYLSGRLKRYQPVRFDALKLAVAQWFLEAGYYSHAAHHARGLSCTATAAQMIEQAGGILRQLDEERVETLEALISPEQAAEWPLLFLSQLYQRIRHGGYIEAKLALDKAWQLTEGFTRLNAAVDPQQIQAWAYLFETVIRVSADCSNQFEYLARIESDMQRYLDSEPIFSASLASVLIFGKVEHAEYEQTIRTAALMQQVLKSPESSRIGLFIYLHQTMALLASECMALAAVSSSHALQQAQSDGLSDSYEMLCAQAVQALVLYEQGDLEEAQRLLQPVLGLVRHVNGWMRLYTESYSIAVAIAGQQQGFDAAEAIIVAAERFAKERQYRRLTVWMLVLRVRELGRAQRWAQAKELVEHHELKSLLAYDAEDAYWWALKIPAVIVCVRLEVEMGRPAQALTQLEVAMKGCPLTLDNRYKLGFELLAMRACYALRRFNAAFKHCQQAIVLLRQGGYVQRAKEAAPYLLEVLSWARRQGKSLPQGCEAWLAQVLPILQGQKAQAHAVVPKVSAKFVLSPRETEIIGLIAQGYINKEIAGLLGISEGTVKSHRKSIHEKLGVSSRSQAISRARELLLI